MAGGMDRRDTAASASERRTTGVAPMRHCWVSDAVAGRGVKRPGLLVEWRPRDGGWEGRVVYGTPLRGEVWAVVEEWVPAALLTPL